jgi:hypothetical protein
MGGPRHLPVVAALGTAQTLAWASTYYLPAMLAVGLFGAWVILGIGMGSGLYEAAFSALVRLYGRDSRNAITGITLIAGFASTIGWPLSNLLEHQVAWQGACYAWAAMHLLVGLPLNLLLPRAESADHASGPAQTAAVGDTMPLAGARAKHASVLLAMMFAATWFISTAMAAHLPRLLQANGTTLATAVAVGALIGPAQVAGRLLEFGFLRRLHPLLSARLAALMHPVGASLLLLVGGPAATVFAVMHGAGNGILTIANGTLPLVLFGTKRYGQR